jgi:hypothetical protein
VTKGRADYLPFTLASLKTTLTYADVQVIIIDNGCPKDVSELLANWCQHAGSNAHYRRFDKNDSAVPRIWNELRNFEIDWITFPGDDDVVRPEFLPAARSIVENNMGLVAIASSMRIIDSSGNSTGQIRNPTEFTGDRIQYLAKSIHEPPFLFPALFLKFNSIQAPLPNSRYVFDWWLSLNLIVAGEISTTNEISIDYRVHNEQESAIAPNRRKYFEAQIVLSFFIQSHDFQNFISKISNLDKLYFWKCIMSQSPIYGDVEFGKLLSSQILLKVTDLISDLEIACEIISIYAARNGVYLREGEARAFIALQSLELKSVAPNYGLEVAKGSCELVYKLQKNEFPVESVYPVFIIGCFHTKHMARYIVDCNFEYKSAENVLDLLIRDITNQLEIEGAFDFKITPIEQKVILNLRIIKKWLPGKLSKYLKLKIRN